jgi:hypothetical protein
MMPKRIRGSNLHSTVVFAMAVDAGKKTLRNIHSALIVQGAGAVCQQLGRQE